MTRLSKRIVDRLPLKELWNERGPLSAVRLRSLSPSDLQMLLRASPVQFAIADVGDRYQWHEIDECHALWKQSIRAHLADPEQPINLDSFPLGYAYCASEWKLPDGQNVVVLETSIESTLHCPPPSPERIVVLTEGKIPLELTSQQALVLFEFLRRVDETEELRFEDQAEERVLWDLEIMIQPQLVEITSPGYLEYLYEAREAVRDSAE